LLHRARPRIRDAGMLGEKGHNIGGVDKDYEKLENRRVLPT